jgi:hypothetical protein
VCATHHGVLSPLLLGAGVHVTVDHFVGLLAAERYSAPSVWHLSASSCIFLVAVLAKCEKSTVWTSLKKSSKVQGRIEVKLLFFKKLHTMF